MCGAYLLIWVFWVGVFCVSFLVHFAITGFGGWTHRRVIEFIPSQKTEKMEKHMHNASNQLLLYILGLDKMMCYAIYDFITRCALSVYDCPLLVGHLEAP